jgi:hypothetical protein
MKGQILSAGWQHNASVSTNTAAQLLHMRTGSLKAVHGSMPQQQSPAYKAGEKAQSRD